jgi:lambda repressor-like predicted transcriptional regulator
MSAPLFDPAAFDESIPTGRLPLAPLLAHFDGSIQALARAARVHLRTIQRYHAEGVTYLQADELACGALGIHPISVWPEWAAAITESEAA